LDPNFSAEAMLAVLQMKTIDSDGPDVGVYRCRTGDETQNNISGSVVTESYGQAKELAQRDVDIGLGIFVLKGAIGVRENPVTRQKAD
jgi:hypothetical protein